MTTIEEVMMDEDAMKVAHKATSKFIGVLPEDEIKQCLYGGIWRASDSFNKNKGTKFTTYLYKMVRYECLGNLRSRKNKNINTMDSSLCEVPNYNKDLNSIDMLDEISKCYDPDIILERFYYNYKLADIAKKRGVSRETVRSKLRKNLDFLKRRLS